MAERIVSPGVFTREKDLSFLPQGIADIGAAIIGPTKKGPAFVPTNISNYNEFVDMFGGLDQDLYVPFTVREYLRSAGTVTVVRVLGLGGYSVGHVHIGAHNASASSTYQTYAILAPNAVNPEATLGSTTATGTVNTFTIVTGSFAFSSSLDPASAKYVENVFSGNPLSEVASTGEASPFYLYKVYKQAATTIAAASSSANVTASIATMDYAADYSNASTPFVTSQKINGSTSNLFKIKLRSHGEDTNNKYKIGVLNVKKAGSIAGSDYGSFSIQVRQVDTQTYKPSDDVIVEQWDNLNLDPNSANFFARKIGDRYVTIDAQGKLTYNGDWPNMSKHIYVSNYDAIKKGTTAVTIVPFGHGPMQHATNSGSAGWVVTPASYIATQTNTSTSEFDTTVFYGFDYTSQDSRQYLSPLTNDAAVGTNVTFSLNDMTGHASASAGDFGGSSTFVTSASNLSLSASNVAQHKFFVPFQGGFDGMNPANEKKTGANIVATNQQGFDCSTATASGSVAYKRAMNAVSNQDEFDINMLATPGLIYTLHPNPINHGIQLCEDRGDAFFIFDPSAIADGISATTTAVSTLDSNYSAAYYPWVKVLDDSINLPTWVPPSVVIPGVFSQNDRVAHEWFAPAGLNRGGLTNVLEAKTRLTHAERDLLYEDRVNPIASFPGQGVVVFGQKTLQAKPSALDRINVRRLLIRIKNFIASYSRYFVFENNTVATRNRFLNIVNPYLESVQSNSGITAFRVVMDDSNNTPDVIDRNQLVGQIFVQPARAVEFIVLDFVVQPTGASFPS